MSHTSVKCRDQMAAGRLLIMLGYQLHKAGTTTVCVADPTKTRPAAAGVRVPRAPCRRAGKKVVQEDLEAAKILLEVANRGAAQQAEGPQRPLEGISKKALYTGAGGWEEVADRWAPVKGASWPTDQEAFQRRAEERFLREEAGYLATMECVEKGDSSPEQEEAARKAAMVAQFESLVLGRTRKDTARKVTCRAGVQTRLSSRPAPPSPPLPTRVRTRKRKSTALSL